MDIIVGCATNYHKDREARFGEGAAQFLLDKGDVLSLFQVIHRGAKYINPRIADADVVDKDGNVVSRSDAKVHALVRIKDALPDEALDGYSAVPYAKDGSNPHHCERGDRAYYLASLWLEAYGSLPANGTAMDSVKGSQAQVDFDALVVAKPEVAARVTKALDIDHKADEGDYIEVTASEWAAHLKPVEGDARATRLQSYADEIRAQAQVAVDANMRASADNTALADGLPDGPVKDLLALRAVEHEEDALLTAEHSEEYATWWEGKKSAEEARRETKRSK